MGDLDGLVLDGFDLLLLVYNLFIQLLEQCRELDHGLLNALDIVVASANGAEDTRGLSGAIALELQPLRQLTPRWHLDCLTYRLLENTLITPVGVCGFVHLLLRRIGIDNAVLPGNGLAIALRVV